MKTTKQESSLINKGLLSNMESLIAKDNFSDRRKAKERRVGIEKLKKVAATSWGEV